MWKNSFGIRIVAHHKAGEGGKVAGPRGMRGGASRCFRPRLEPGTEKEKLRRQLAKQGDHFESRLGTFDPFVADVPTGAMDGLFERIARENAK